MFWKLKCGGLLFDRHKPPLTRRFMSIIAPPLIPEDVKRTFLLAINRVFSRGGDNFYFALDKADYLEDPDLGM